MKPKYLQVRDNESMYRDTESGTVVNLDGSLYAKHKQSKELAKKRAEQERQKETRLNNLEQDVQQLKEGINQILDLLKHGT